MAAITLGDVAAFYLGLVTVAACAVAGGLAVTVAVLSARWVGRRRARRTR